MTPRWLAIVAAVAVLAACNRAPSNPPDTATSPAAAGDHRQTVSLITHEPPGDTFWDVVRRGAQAAADSDGLDLEYLHDPNPATQAGFVREAVTKGVAGIAVTLADPPVLSPAVRAAAAAGIPVVVLNTGIADWDALGALSYFGQDDGIAGRAAGERLSRGQARHVLCVIQATGHVGLDARCAGTAAAFHGAATTIYVDGTRPNDVKAAIVAKLQADRSIDRVLTLSAAVALTALQAVGEANSYAKVATFDTNPAVIDAIKGGTLTWAIDQQPYLQGYLAVDALSLYLRNGNVIGGGQPTLTGPAFVDQTNVDSVAERAEEGTR